MTRLLIHTFIRNFICLRQNMFSNEELKYLDKFLKSMNFTDRILDPNTVPPKTVSTTQTKRYMKILKKMLILKNF